MMYIPCILYAWYIHHFHSIQYTNTNEIYVQARSGRAKQATLLVVIIVIMSLTIIYTCMRACITLSLEFTLAPAASKAHAMST